MTEDGFQLSAHDVRHQECGRAMRDSDPSQVDDFKERIAQEFDRLWRDRGQINDRLQSMMEQLKDFRDRERAMNDALIAAQQLWADVQSQTDKEAGLMLQRARGQADQTLLEARNEAERLMERARVSEERLHYSSETMRQQFLAYVTSYRRPLERELDALASADTRAEARADAGLPRPA